MTYELSKHLATLHGPLVGNNERHIRDSRHFVEKLKDLSISDSECMVSFDVKALFTSIPVPEAINAVQRALLFNSSWRDRTSLSYHNICRLLEFVLTTTYFTFNDKFYQQNFGCAMGSPVSPVVANIYMEDYEEWALMPELITPRIWYRYVDDTFSVIERDNVERFHQYLNGVNPHMQFTREMENTNAELPFLDVLVHRTREGGCTTSVYRKPTHTGQFLQWTSHHPLHQKVGVVRTLSRRVEVISGQPSDLKAEKTLLAGALWNCDYPDWVIKKGFKRRADREPPQDEIEHKGFASIPYVKGVSEPISRVLHEAGL